MDVLVLGGTAWLGREVSGQAVASGHRVTCLARGESGSVAAGATLVAADRAAPAAYDDLPVREWDAVIDVSRQPGQVRSALAALAGRARHWTFVSSCSVYATHATLGADESSPLLPPLVGDDSTDETYGEAKVAGEEVARQAVGDRLLVARAGLIGGPGDHTGRTGWWVARAARGPAGPLLVPDSLEQPTQVVDVRDLAGWLLGAAAAGTTGGYDAVGPVRSLGGWIELSRTVAAHTADVVPVAPGWLLEQGVTWWSGPASLPMWLGERGYEGFMTRTGAGAVAAGLRHRPTEEVLVDTLAWEREQGLGRARPAGLSGRREQELLSAWAARR